MVEVEKVGLGGACELQLPRPRLDLTLVGVVVEARQNRVLGPGPVLVRTVHRGGPGPAVEPQRVSARQGRGEVDRPQVEARVEARRERVLTEIGAGLSNAEIADKLRISGATVKSHINHLLAKTGSRDRGQLVGYAFRHGLAA